MVIVLLLTFVISTSNIEDDRRLAEEHQQEGTKSLKNGKFKEALESYHEALLLFSSSKDSLGMADAYYNMGAASFYNTDFAKCLYYYDLSEAIFMRIKNESGLAKVNIGLGNYYFYHEKNYEKGLTYYLNCMEVCKNNGEEKMLMMTFNNIASVYSTNRKKNEYYDLDSAKLYYKQALNQSYALVDSFQMGITLMNLGILEQSNQPDSSLYYYALAEEIFVDLEANNNLAGLFVNQATLFKKRSWKKKSIDAFTKSLNFSLKYNYWDFILSSSRNLAHSYEELHDSDSALKYQKLYMIYKDSIYNEKNSKEIENLKVKYETEKKDQEIKIQQAELELTNAEKERLMYILLISLGFTVIIIYIYTQRQKAVKNLRNKEAELHTQEVGKLIQEQELKSINSMLEGEEKERKRIAEDLHDRVGSMISAMKLQSDSSNKKMVSLLDETADEVRRISHNLETQVLNRFGLAAALEDLADKIKSSGKIEFELHHLDLDERLDNEIEINTYRIVQELISNALKHSQATIITTQVNCLDDQLIIMVEDNGVGFDSLLVKEQGGMGLNNVASRAHELDGNLNVDSGKGQGTVITVDIPL